MLWIRALDSYTIILLALTFGDIGIMLLVVDVLHGRILQTSSSTLHILMRCTSEAKWRLVGEDQLLLVVLPCRDVLVFGDLTFSEQLA